MEAVNYTRHLSNVRATIANPDYLENEIRKLIHSQTEVSLEVIKGEELKNMGMNLHYEVGKGAESPPRYVAVKYSGNKNSD